MKTYVLIAVPVILALFSSLGIIPFVIKWVNKKGLLVQLNDRTSHDIPTPTMGGIGIFLGFLMVLPFITYDTEIITLLIGVVVLFVTGFIDDCYDLKSLLKFAIQLGCASIIYWGGFRINNLHGILGINEIPELVSCLVTIVFITGVTNAFNLIDGIDGLAGGISLINAFFFGLIFIMNDQLNFALIAFVLCGSIVGFLKYNFSPAKIFMGDTGSLFLGLLMSVFMIKTFQTNASAELSVAGSVALIFIPVFDTIRLFADRILNKKSPFLADKNHLHHLVLKVIPKHTYATLTILCLHGLLLILTFMSFYLNSHVVLTILITLLILGVSLFLCIVIVVGLWEKVKLIKQMIKSKISKNTFLKNI
jgi:UDP-GlcNAc:undecaprenyl-phosphate GlcNAc-1-phosphate transferase